MAADRHGGRCPVVGQTLLLRQVTDRLKHGGEARP